jgi:hypothetical protein
MENNLKGGMIMSVKVLQINFKFNIPSADLKNGLAPFVEDIAVVSGLRWKVWIMNEQENEAGGIYAKEFDVVEDFTTQTRGPIK